MIKTNNTNRNFTPAHTMQAVGGVAIVRQANGYNHTVAEALASTPRGLVRHKWPYNVSPMFAITESDSTP
ncbi:MAG: hypothetical protein IJ789_04120 [Bacteroidales bacterium]|nr:hypothetical protein [Bacteroidales bacterium]